MPLFRPGSKLSQRDRMALVVAIAAEVAGISTIDMLDKINARLAELTGDGN